MSRLEEFARLFELPPAMWPHLSYVADEREVDLVLGLAGRALPVAEIAALLGMSLDEAAVFVRRAYTRAVLEREPGEGEPLYKASTFYHRLDPLSMYEGWGDVPADARDAVIAWQLAEFIDKWLPTVEDIRRDPEAHVRIPNRDVLLLEEALAMVDAAQQHVVVPCDCRAIVMACKRPLEGCIRLDEGAERTLERGMGRSLTRAECHQLIIDLDRAGLMHTGQRDWQARGSLFGFCNCCADDCYPIRGGIAMGMQRQWPRAHYVAQRDDSVCGQCGLCARRCHFDAFYQDGTTVEVNGKSRKHVAFDAEKCWGCGLCATACPDSAIQMVAVSVGA